MIVSFCGHRDVYDKESVRSWLKKVIEALIEEGFRYFYSGGYGAFDRMVAGVLREVSLYHPHIESILVVAYLEKNPYSEDYDKTYYPDLEGVPRRFAISKRNEIMVNESSVLVAYVTQSWGGAAKTLAHGRKKGKRIILYSEQDALGETK